MSKTSPYVAAYWGWGRKRYCCSKSSNPTPIPTHAAMGIKPNLLLMTCRILVEVPDGSSVEVWALLDSASSASFVSEQLAQSLRLPRSHQNIRISGVTGLTHDSSTQHVVNFKVSSLHSPSRKFNVSAVIVPCVRCNLPLHPIPLNPKWEQLARIQLADPGFGEPGKFDILLGVEVFVKVMHRGWRLGASGSLMALETEFGWVLVGGTFGVLVNESPPRLIWHSISVLGGGGETNGPQLSYSWLLITPTLNTRAQLM